MIFLPCIVFIVLLLIWWLKIRSLNIGIYVLIIYLVSSIASIFMYYSGAFSSGIGYAGKDNIGLLPALVYCSLIVLSILPFYRYRSDRIKSITPVNEKLFNWVSYFFIFVFAVT